MGSPFFRFRRRWSSALLAVMLVFGGCAAPTSDDDEQLLAWCAAAEEMAEAGRVFEQDPETVDPIEYERAIERGEAFFATAAPAEVRDQVDLLSDEESDAGFEEVEAALRDVNDFAEANCDNIDPGLFDASE